MAESLQNQAVHNSKYAHTLYIYYGLSNGMSTKAQKFCEMKDIALNSSSSSDVDEDEVDFSLACHLTKSGGSTYQDSLEKCRKCSEASQNSALKCCDQNSQIDSDYELCKEMVEGKTCYSKANSSTISNRKIAEKLSSVTKEDDSIDKFHFKKNSHISCKSVSLSPKKHCSQPSFNRNSNKRKRKELNKHINFEEGEILIKDALVLVSPRNRTRSVSSETNFVTEVDYHLQNPNKKICTFPVKRTKAKPLPILDDNEIPHKQAPSSTNSKKCNGTSSYRNEGIKESGMSGLKVAASSDTKNSSIKKHPKENNTSSKNGHFQGHQSKNKSVSSHSSKKCEESYHGSKISRYRNSGNKSDTNTHNNSGYEINKSKSTESGQVVSGITEIPNSKSRISRCEQNKSKKLQVSKNSEKLKSKNRESLYQNKNSSGISLKVKLKTSTEPSSSSLKKSQNEVSGSSQTGTQQDGGRPEHKEKCFETEHKPVSITCEQRLDIGMYDNYPDVYNNSGEAHKSTTEVSKPHVRLSTEEYPSHNAALLSPAKMFSLREFDPPHMMHLLQIIDKSKMSFGCFQAPFNCLLNEASVALQGGHLMTFLGEKSSIGLLDTCQDVLSQINEYNLSFIQSENNFLSIQALEEILFWVKKASSSLNSLNVKKIAASTILFKDDETPNFLKHFLKFKGIGLLDPFRFHNLCQSVIKCKAEILNNHKATQAPNSFTTNTNQCTQSRHDFSKVPMIPNSSGGGLQQNNSLSLDKTPLYTGHVIYNNLQSNVGLSDNTARNKPTAPLVLNKSDLEKLVENYWLLEIEPRDAIKTYILCLAQTDADYAASLLKRIDQQLSIR